MKRFLKILRNTAFVIIGLIILLVVLINIPAVQNYAAQKATQILSDKLKTKVSIKNLHVDLLNKLVLEELYIQDKNQDTLLYAGEARVRITDWFILKKGVPVIEYIGLKNTYGNLYRKKDSDEWNYQFVIDAFDTGSKKLKKKKNNANFEIDLEDVELENVRFHMDDAWVGTDMDFDVGTLDIDADKIDLKKRIVDISTINITNTAVIMRDYDGGRPPKPKTEKKTSVIDTTPFNPDLWKISADKISLEDCIYKLDAAARAPYPEEFDPSHIGVSEIYLEARDINIIGDTLKANLKHLAAHERSGFILQQLSAKVTVSPNISECKDLVLKSNNSTITDYYAMHYTRFPDFQDYIEKVKMEAHFKGSKVDSRDVAYFAPPLKEYSSIVNISGNVIGTVTDIAGTGLNVSDGLTLIKGNLHMKGLPDINTTFINYTNGTLRTSGKGILKYAPSLGEESSPVAVEKIDYLNFDGDFNGYINNFAIDGYVASNLGDIKSNVKLYLPSTNERLAKYSGNILANQLDIGTLLKEDDLGKVSFNAQVAGTALDIKHADVELDATFSLLEYKNYGYQDIIAEGKIGNNKFSGSLIVNDPNLALGFYGEVDFKDEIVNINAKANLLNSNLTALNLIKSDSGNVDTFRFTADFDLDCKASSIEDFVGYAKLYNINLTRNNNRLDIDSVYITSTKAGAQKNITIESNAIAANISGDYHLTTLPASLQYYISGYIPNYISPPSYQLEVQQDLKFKIETRNLDSLFYVFAPSIRGFDYTTISGSLNTRAQQLSLYAQIPSGVINNVSVRNITIDGSGNFKDLKVNANAERVVVGDSIIAGSVDIKTKLGSDSLNFSIVTSSFDSIGSASLNGRVYAHGDTLEASILPSEIYLNQIKWEIPGKNVFTITDGYLHVNQFSLVSGIQKLHISSRDSGLAQLMVLDIEHLDVAQLGNLAGLTGLQPDGRIDGNVQLRNPLGKLKATGNVKVSNLVLSGDTLGNLILAGSYDKEKKLVTLDKPSGMYYKSSQLIASGGYSFDTTAAQTMYLKVDFREAPLLWLQPFLVGYLSKMTGVLNGDVSITGTSTKPDINGVVRLQRAGMHIDFLGSYYNIPEANMSLNNKEIDLGNFKILDTKNNSASVDGRISHDRFRNFNLNINATSKKLEVINLKESENEVFYGNLIAGFENLSVRGPVNDISINIQKATPVEKSTLYIPLSEEDGVGGYSYISFKDYGTEQVTFKKKNENKLSIDIEAIMNPLAKIVLVMDPIAGDAISATGEGTIRISLPSSNDIRMYGTYKIEEGDYLFTFKQLFINRTFQLNRGSTIAFNGPIDRTSLNVEGIYRTRARLYDMLTTEQKKVIEEPPGNRDATQAKQSREVDVLLYMTGTLVKPELNFDISIPDKTSVAGTYAYNKLEYVNQNKNEQLNEVAALLLLNTFIPTEGGLDAGAASGAINNVSDILSNTASSQLTNLITKITGDKTLAIDLKYKTYNYNTTAISTAERNELSLGIRKNYFNDRLTIEVGSYIDWGKGTSANRSSNFSPVGDFKLQYQFRQGSNLRGYIFRTTSYDIVVDKPIGRSGIGISWRKTFDNLGEFFKGANSKKEESQN